MSYWERSDPSERQSFPAPVVSPAPSLRCSFWTGSWGNCSSSWPPEKSDYLPVLQVWCLGIYWRGTVRTVLSRLIVCGPVNVFGFSADGTVTCKVWILSTGDGPAKKTLVTLWPPQVLKLRFWTTFSDDLYHYLPATTGVRFIALNGSRINFWFPNRGGDLVYFFFRNYSLPF